MTTSEKQQNILAIWQTHRPAINGLQEHYLAHANRGSYFVGMPSHAVLPDGETKSPVDMSAHPGDSTHDYADFLRGVKVTVDPETGEPTETHTYPVEATAAFAELSACVRFDALDLPGGDKSWQVTFEYDDGDHWSYTEDKDGNVVADWHVVTPIEMIE